MREICQGENVDMGTAATLRVQWLREAGTSWMRGPPQPLLLVIDQCPGDAVVMTAAIWSLHRAWPGRYATAVESKYPEVFAHNPDVVPAESIPGAARLQMHYPAIHDSNRRGIHFMQGCCEHLGAALGVEVPLLTNRPWLYFSEPTPPVDDYWVVCSGGKSDFTNKLWGYRNYQKVVNELGMVHSQQPSERVRFVQVGAAREDHPYLKGQLGGTFTTDFVGITTLRELFDIVRRSRGVLCGVSLLMHVAAALEKPAVVVAGGREPVQWNAYPKQQYLHTVGALPCTSTQGDAGAACWRSRVVPLGDGTVLDNDTCQRPVNINSFHTLPECMTMIRPEEVVEKIRRYNSQYIELNQCTPSLCQK